MPPWPTLVTFLRARLDEDEAAAKAAAYADSGGNWRYEEQARPVPRIIGTTSLTGQAERFLPELVTSARLNDHTCDQIAAALATSPEQAQLRYGDESPVADTRWPYDL